MTNNPRRLERPAGPGTKRGTETMQFSPATREGVKLRMALSGPSGSGKTYSALRIASALPGDRVALIDTERRSSCKYAGEANPDGGAFEFDVLHLQPPYHPDRFVDAMRAAVDAGYSTVIIDSITHAWNGQGGVIDLVDGFGRKYSGNKFAGWKDVKPIENRFIGAMLDLDAHLIVTMRAKTEYVIAERNGKKSPEKVGMAPEQRAGIEYEFDVVLDLDHHNRAFASKTRCSAIAGQSFVKPGADLAAILTDWLSVAEGVGPGGLRNVEEMTARAYNDLMAVACKRSGVNREDFKAKWGAPAKVPSGERVNALNWVKSHVGASEIPGDSTAPKGYDGDPGEDDHGVSNA